MGTAYRSCKLSNFCSPSRTHPKSRTHHGTRTCSATGAAMMGTGLTLVTNQHGAPMANVANAPHIDSSAFSILALARIDYSAADGPTVLSLRRKFLLYEGRLSRVISCTDLAPISVMVTRMSLAKSSNRCETPRCPAAANSCQLLGSLFFDWTRVGPRAICGVRRVSPPSPGTEVIQSCLAFHTERSLSCPRRLQLSRPRR
jgi:hypothetical protein